MTYRVILQPRAERDIRHVARWKLERAKSPESALRWVRSLRAKIDTLKASPHRCPIDPDSDVHGVEVRVLYASQEFPARGSGGVGPTSVGPKPWRIRTWPD